MPNITFEPNSKAQAQFLSASETDVLFGGAAGSGKRLDLTESIPTQSGWVAVGSVRVGDVIFTELGETTTVTDVHPIDLSPETYLLRFDDGTEIRACADHQWLTFNVQDLSGLTKRTDEWRKARRERRPSRATGSRGEYFTKLLTERNKKNPPKTISPPTGTVKTTKEIANTLRVGQRCNHAIPVAKAVDLPEKNFLVEPYLLGLWLGDGYTASGQIGMMESDWVGILPHIKRPVVGAKIDIRPPRIKPFAALKFDGLRNDLKYLGLIDNKHIPQEYLRGSIEQRLELLCGLMDSDGTASGGRTSFTNTNKRIVDGVQELVCSLGWKCSVIEGRAKVNGKDCGAVWDISFTPSEKTFHLPRKRDKQRLATRRTTKFRYIVSCERVESVPMRCISVDNPTHLWLVGRSFLPTHNSQSIIIDPLRYIDHPRFTAMIYRETFPQLERSIIQPAMRFYKAAGGEWKDQKKVFEFPSGARIGVGYLEHDGDWMQYQGFAQCAQYFDEITNLHWNNVVMLRAWNRSEAEGILAYRRATANPGGISHLQVKAHYVDTCQALPDGERRFSKLANMWWQPMKAGDTYWFRTENGLLSSRRFIPARVFDNEDLLRLNPEYLQTLLSLPPDKRKGLLDGDWNVFEGQFFNLRTDVHVIPPIAEPPVRMSAVKGGLDFGKVTVLSVAFRDYEGNIVLFAQTHPQGDSPGERAEMIAKWLLERKLYKLHIIYDVNMEAIFTHLGYERSPISTFRDVFRQRMGDNAPILTVVSKKRVEDKFWRVACNEAFKDVLRFEMDEQGKIIRRPRFFVTSDCVPFLTSVPGLIHDVNSPGGLDYDQSNNVNDHDFESFKFVLMALRTPAKEVTKKPYATKDAYMDEEVFRRIQEANAHPKKLWTKL